MHYEFISTVQANDPNHILKKIIHAKMGPTHFWQKAVTCLSVTGKTPSEQ